MIVPGQTAVITGGGGGIGLSVAEALGARGLNIVIADVAEQAAHEAAAGLRGSGIRSLGVACDVRDELALDAVRQAALGEFGSVDILMNNVGVPLLGRVEQIPVSDWEWLLDLNVLGMVRALRVFLPDMLAAGAGHIVFTTSVLAVLSGHPMAGNAVPYITSKGAVLALAQSLEMYLRPHGIGVTVLAPDHTDTNFQRSGRLVGDLELSPDANPYPAQTPAQAAAALIDALDSGAFLASPAPGCAEMLSLQAANKLAPSAMTPHYYSRVAVTEGP